MHFVLALNWDLDNKIQFLQLSGPHCPLSQKGVSMLLPQED